MRFTTFYFSGTGNTQWTVNQFHRILTEAGHESKVFSIDKNAIEKPEFYLDIYNKSDYIGFANPIYGGDIPPIMRKFIGKLIRLTESKEKYSKQVYFINTFAYVNGFGPICAKKLLRNTAFRIISYVNIRLCNNVSRPGLKMKEISKNTLHQRKERAVLELKKMTVRILSGKCYITGIGPYLIPNILVRKASMPKIENNYKELSININTCSKCMRCIKNCPTGSITYIENGFQFLSVCTACMRCYNNCPTCSISFHGEYADPAEYKRYHGPE